MAPRDRRPVVVAVAGPSGAGKSTVSRLLGGRPGWRRLREAYDRLRPRPRLDPASQAELLGLERRFLDEEARRFDDAREQLRLGRSVVADTGFLDPVGYTAGLVVLGAASGATFRQVTAHALRLAREGRLGLADLTVYLSVPRRLRRGRASRDPLRHPVELRERHERVGEIDATLVRDCLSRAAPGRVRAIRATGRAPSVADRLAELAGRTTPQEEPSAAATRALEILLADRSLRAATAPALNLKKATPSPGPLR